MSLPEALTLLDLIQSHRITAVIYVAAQLGIADRLSDGPKSLDDLAKATGANRAALRLLTALRTIGICEPGGSEQYTLRYRRTACRRNPAILQGLGHLRRANAIE